MRVTMIARTRFNEEVAEDLTKWEPDGSATDAASLSEFAGRACYQSWDKPNPGTRWNTDYLAHILEVGHLSVLEHGTATFYIEDVSRSLTHELVRHRHMSPSQLSQRYHHLGWHTKPVVPPLYRAVWEDEGDLTRVILEKAWGSALDSYDQLVRIWERRLLDASGLSKLDTSMRKQAREAARCVLPNMTPTAVVLSGNHRTWRHFLRLRGSLHADAEIRGLALEIHRWLESTEPALYQDFKTMTDPGNRVYLECTTPADE